MSWHILLNTGHFGITENIIQNMFFDTAQTVEERVKKATIICQETNELKDPRMHVTLCNQGNNTLKSAYMHIKTHVPCSNRMLKIAPIFDNKFKIGTRYMAFLHTKHSNRLNLMH
jgi:hypothetical protein